MKVVNFVTVLVLLGFLLLSSAQSDFGFAESFPVQDVSEVWEPDYDRLGEVQKSCSSLVNSGLDLTLNLDHNEINVLKDDLSFSNGDWEQKGNSSPIMPFVNSLVSNSSRVGVGYRRFNRSFGSKIPYKLTSFKLNDISLDHKTKKTIAVNGKLSMVITSNLPLASIFHGREAGFNMWEGHSRLLVDFQGIYTEQKNNNGGERVLCLLGSSLLPSRQSDSHDPWESAKMSGGGVTLPPLLQDDQILLILHIPKKASLQRMAIQGEMRSLNPKSNEKYFDDVEITSQLTAKTHHYEFSTSEVVSKACDPYPYPDSNPSVNSGNEFYKGLDFCEMITKVSTDASFSVAPHWRCNGTDAFCSKFGPFGFDKKINATDGSFNDTRILMHNIYCVADDKAKQAKPGNSSELSARVFAAFRAFDSPDNQFLENQRSGFGNMTLVAEGTWNSSSGQLCMIGCLGTIDSEESDCNSRICLYIPLSFSIKQRSLLIGSISSIEKNSPPFYPLSLEVLYQSLDYIYNGYTYKRPYYQYTKIGDAGTILEKDEPFSFGTVIKRSLLTFPKLQDSEDYHESLRILAEDLTLHVSALPDPRPKSRDFGTDVQMEVLSLGPMFGRDWFSDDSITISGSPFITNASYTEKQLLVNVSTQMKLRGGPYSNFTNLYLEGLYDQHVGKMYLIGCRDVRASWKVLFDDKEFLDSGLDCSIEVIISFPPTTARWLVAPTASVSISSQRTEDDPLFFKPLKLLTLPILYRQQREDILSRRSFEGILKILTLSITIGCILRQLLYLRSIPDSIPYMSLTMLGSQVIGFALPLVIGAEALSKSANSESSYSPFEDLEKSQLTQVLEYTVKLQVLVCFILTLRLCQKVWRGRVRLLGQVQNPNAPSEKRVVLVTAGIHILGYLSALIFHSVKTGQTPIWTQQYVDPNGNPRSLKTWETVLQEYTGLLQDLFLLPQVIGNIVWQIDSKPLSKLYYIGITILRLLPHGYDYIRGPTSTPFFSEEYEFANRRFDFYSEFGDISIPCLAVAFAVVVFIQQRWNYEKLGNALKIGKFRVLPVSSRMYEKIPTESAESELVSDPVRSKIQKDED